MSVKGTGRIYQRGHMWWIDYGYRGTRHRESSGSARKGDAVALLRRRLEEMGRGRLVGPSAERVMFTDLERGLIDDYAVNGRKSIRRVRGALAHLRRTFGFHRALDITTDRVNAYIRQRQESSAANATIQKELAALKRMFTLAVRAGQLATAPHIPGIRVDNVREGFFEAAELEAVVRELPEALRPVVRFAGLTGWRKSEVLGLRWRQVDFQSGIVRLEPGTTKNDDGREFPFGALPPLADLLKAQREGTREVERRTGQIIPWVFHRDGQRIRDLRTAWEGACRRAGVPGAWFHDLRRTAVRNLERAGVPRSVAMKLTGHKTESVYRRYAIADSKALEEGVGKLARLHAAEPARGIKPLAIGGASEG